MRLLKAATLYVAATVVPPTTAAGQGSMDAKLYGVKVSLLARDGYRCDDDDDFRIVNGERHDPTTAVLDTDLASNRYDRRCPSKGIGILEVARRGTAYGQQALPIELVVRVEPPADTSRVPAAYKKALPGLPQPTFGTVSPTSAGSSFNDATELRSGVPYSDRIVTGEDRFYKVALRWGQRFAFSVKETGPPSPANGVQVLAWMDFYNPMRQAVSMTGDDTSGRRWFAQRDEDPFTGSTDVPVRYTNRTSIENRHYQLDGFYYLRLNADFAKKQASTRYLVTVVVSGSPEPGPVYRPDATEATTPPTTPSTTEPSTTPSVSPSPPTGPSSQPSLPDPNATVASSAASGAAGGGIQPLVVALAALLVLGGLGGAVLLARARRRQPPLDTQR